METLTVEQVRSEMIKNAKAYNNVLTAEYLEGMNTEQIMAFVHPLDRNTFKEKLTKIFRERVKEMED